VIGSFDGVAQQTPTDLNDLIRAVCARLLRDLTDEERTIYGHRQRCADLLNLAARYQSSHASQIFASEVTVTFLSFLGHTHWLRVGGKLGNMIQSLSMMT